MDSSIELLYSEPAKWERHSRGHTYGQLNLSRDRLWFVPDSQISVIKTGFNIPLSEMAEINRSDNWLWRGKVNIRLVHTVRIEISFKIDPETLAPGMEQDVFQSDTLCLFLGSARKRFLDLIQGMGIHTKV